MDDPTSRATPNTSRNQPSLFADSVSSPSKDSNMEKAGAIIIRKKTANLLIQISRQYNDSSENKAI
jgi:hypothetical protein